MQTVLLCKFDITQELTRCTTRIWPVVDSFMSRDADNKIEWFYYRDCPYHIAALQCLIIPPYFDKRSNLNVST